MKTCNSCGILKDKTAYNNGSICKECYNKKRRDRYKNGEAAKIAESKRKWRKKNPQSVLVTWAKSRAKKKNLDFNITPEDIIIPDICPILGIKLENGNGCLIDSSPTIDRINPALGYVKGNIEVISYRANRIKNDATLDELKKVVDHLSKK